MDSWNRLELLVGNEKVNKMQEKKVVIIGLGGVGGYVVETLARSGIRMLILIDYDVVEESNINRQIIALNSTIGKNKTKLWEMRIKDINPNCNVIIKNVFLSKENIESIIPNDVDYIIDACDTVQTKKELIRYSIQNQIKLISSMGMGNRQDPTKVIITTLDQTNYDPIAKILRKMVRDERIKEKIYVVSSLEQPLKHQKIIASNVFVPAIAGLLCAHYVIKDIVGEK